MFYIGSQKITPGLFSKSEGQTITCINRTGANITTGEKVYIAANSNYTLIPENKFVASISFTGIATQNIANGSSGKVSCVMTEPASGLDLYSRIDNKATVAGFYTDGNGTTYAVCVVDAQYRSGNGMAWATNDEYRTDTILPNYDWDDVINCNESATYNTDMILNTYSANDFPAFNFARNACEITFNNATFRTQLPNIKELQILYNARNVLDNLDPTLNNYSERSLSIFKCGGNSGIWSSNEQSGNNAWQYYPNGSYDYNGGKYTTDFGVCPIIEIPVLE